MGVILNPGETSLRVNLCAIEGETFETARILSHNGGSIEGEEAVELMQDLIHDPRFVSLAAPIGFSIHVTPTFRHTGVIDAAHEPDRSGMRFTEPHNILGQPLEGHMPAGVMGEELTALMRVSYEVLRDHPVNKARIAQGKLPAFLAPTIEANEGLEYTGDPKTLVEIVPSAPLASAEPVPYTSVSYAITPLDEEDADGVDNGNCAALHAGKYHVVATFSYDNYEPTTSEATAMRSTSLAVAYCHMVRYMPNPRNTSRKITVMAGARRMEFSKKA